MDKSEENIARKLGYIQAQHDIAEKMLEKEYELESVSDVTGLEMKDVLDLWTKNITKRLIKNMMDKKIIKADIIEILEITSDDLDKSLKEMKEGNMF